MVGGLDAVLSLRSASGVTQLRLTVPDSITTWQATGFSLNADSGLGVSKDPTGVRVMDEKSILHKNKENVQLEAKEERTLQACTLNAQVEMGAGQTAQVEKKSQKNNKMKHQVCFAFRCSTCIEKSRVHTFSFQLRVFKEFFVSLDLPYFMIMGEEAKMLIVVFNYKSEEQEVRQCCCYENELWLKVRKQNSLEAGWRRRDLRMTQLSLCGQRGWGEREVSVELSIRMVGFALLCGNFEQKP